MNVKYYFRYMDDIVVLGSSKEELRLLLIEINKYFINNLRLELKRNHQIFPTYVRGVDYLGYRSFGSYTLLRKSTCKNMKRRMTQIRRKVELGEMMNYSEWCSINSYKGWLKHCNSFRLSRKYIEPLKSYADAYYESQIKRSTKNEGLRKAEKYN